MKKIEILKDALAMDRTELVPSKVCKTKIIHVTQDEFCELFKHLNDRDVPDGCDCDTIFIGNYIFKKK